MKVDLHSTPSANISCIQPTYPTLKTRIASCKLSLQRAYSYCAKLKESCGVLNHISNYTTILGKSYLIWCSPFCLLLSQVTAKIVHVFVAKYPPKHGLSPLNARDIGKSCTV